MATRARQSRLSHRGPRLSIFGSARADPRRGRCARYRARDRDIPSRRARGRPPAPLHGGPAWHGSRSHACFPPALRRVDAGPVPPLGRQDRAQHRGADRRRARQPAASRTGFSYLPWHPASLSRRRSGARRSGFGPRPGDRRARLQERPLSSPANATGRPRKTPLKPRSSITPI